MRAAIEATVRSVKHPFSAGKLPVRGKFRVACLLIGSAAIANIRRIQRYLEAKIRLENEPKDPRLEEQGVQESSASSIYVWLKGGFGGLTAPGRLCTRFLGC